MSLPLREYDIAVARREALCSALAGAEWRKGHSGLAAALATDRADWHRSAVHGYYSGDPGRILDGSGKVVADDYRRWVREQLAEHGGSPIQVWRAHREKDWTITWITRELRYYWHQRGAHPWDGEQLAIWARQEFPGKRMFGTSEWERVEDESDLLNPRGERQPDAGTRPLGPGFYQLDAAVDVEMFYRLGQRLDAEAVDRAAGARVRVIPQGDVTEVRSLPDAAAGAPAGSYDTTAREAMPEAFATHRWRVQRWFTDWAYSSAGRSGAIAGHHWSFNLSDWDSGNAQLGRQLNFTPAWAHTAKVAKIENTHRLGDEQLYERLLRLQERTGSPPFGWYFYLLHGNLVKDGTGLRMAEAAEHGRIDLPDWDRQVLSAWAAHQYGF